MSSWWKRGLISACVCFFFFLLALFPERCSAPPLAPTSISKHTPTHTCTLTHTHTHTAVAARDIPAAAALSLPRTRPPSDLPGGRMPNESRACLPLPRSMCVCVCVCVCGGGMAGRLGASARGKGEGEWGDDREGERKKKTSVRRVGGLKRSLPRSHKSSEARL